MLQATKHISLICILVLLLVSLASCAREAVEVMAPSLNTKEIVRSSEATPVVDFIVPDDVGEDIFGNEYDIEAFIESLVGKPFDGGDTIMRFERDGHVLIVDHYGDNVSRFEIVRVTGSTAADITINGRPWHISISGTVLTLESDDFTFVGAYRE